ncbi:MAG TPA: hypothetical protein PLU49_13545 [Saprospiraceae bacterium]|nr:hypothetical protein [Saprospiraceae bacterium]
MEEKQIVLDTFKNSEKPLKAGEVAAITGIEKAKVDKIIKELKKTEEIYSPVVCFYTAKK